eukprot:jgi/Botrbrau1/20782/Bobra.0156s0013.1
MEEFWLKVCLAAVVLVYLYGLRPFTRICLRHIPGPAPKWLLGNLLEMRKMGAHTAYDHWARQFGPVFKVLLGATPVVVVADADLARKVLMLNNDRPSLPGLQRGRQAQLDRESLVTAKGQKWRALRGAWSPVFYTASLEGYAECMQRSVDHLFEQMDRVAAQASPVDISVFMRTLALSVIGASAFGVDFTMEDTHDDDDDDDDDDAEEHGAGKAQHDAGEPSTSGRTGNRLVEAIHEFFRQPGRLSLYTLAAVIVPPTVPLLRFVSSALPDRTFRRQDTIFSVLIDESTKLLEKARQSGSGGEGGEVPGGRAPLYKDVGKGDSMRQRCGIHVGGFLQSLIGRIDCSTGLPFSDTTIISQAFIMIVAGFVTTASALSFALYQLGSHPGKMERLLQEIDALGNYDQRPTYDQLMQQFPYLEAVIWESLRLLPPIPNLTGRLLKQDMDLGGYLVPRGTWVQVAAWSIQRNEQWWEDPEAFLPERWLEGTPEAKRRPHHAFYAFGDGPRSCVGSRFAMEEMKIALMRILQRYSIKLCRPGLGEPLPLSSNFLLAPRDGILMKLQHRGPCVPPRLPFQSEP